MTPEALEARVVALASTGVCFSGSFSRDGGRVAFISDLSGVPQAWTVAAQGGWPERVTALPDQVMQVAWNPERDLLALLVAPGGGLNSQLYVIRPDGTDLRLLTQGGTDNNWLIGWTPDGSRLMTSSSRDDAARMDSFLVDAESGRDRKSVV